MTGNKHFVTAMILAAGNGSRMNSDRTKQQITLLGESILKRTVKTFSSSDMIDHIVVACREDEIDWAKDELDDITKPVSIIVGGKNRAESSYYALKAVPKVSDFVAIHDGARCLVTVENIEAVLKEAFIHGAATAGTFVSDSVKQCADGFIEATIPRESVFLAQTPQVFSRKLYEKAINSVPLNESYTDDNMLAQAIGIKIFAVNTGKQNIKITTAEDLPYAEYILKEKNSMSEIRVGHGYDVHRLVEGRRLILGGVEIPHEKGLLGHSDADVLVHAIMDALLGACGLGDIGKHFPDSSDKYKDISSLVLLEKVCEIVKNEGYSIVNIDATLVMQRPKIAPYIDLMIANISKILHLECGRMNIKATTEEGLGFTGREEGASAYAVATVKK